MNRNGLKFEGMRGSREREGPDSKKNKGGGERFFGDERVLKRSRLGTRQEKCQT